MSSLFDRIFFTDVRRSEEANPVSVLLRQCKKSFVLVALITLAIEVLSLTPIIFMWNVFDRVLSTRSGVTLGSLLAVVLLSYGFWSALEWIRTRLMIRISLRIDWDIAAKVFDTAFRRYVQRKDVDVHQVLEDVVRLRQFLTGKPILLMMSLPFGIIFILIGWAFHPYLAIFIFVATVVQLVAAFTTSQISSPALRQANEAAAASARIASQSLRYASTALPLGMLSNIRRAWFVRHQQFLGLQVNASESAGLIGGVTSFLDHALPSMQLAMGAYLAIQGHITAGMVIAASFLLTRSIRPIKGVIASWPHIVSARQSLERLNLMVSEDEEISARMALPDPIGHLSVEQLTMAFSGRPPILNGLQFELNPGSVLGVIGPTASGKTSLTRCLVGLWQPSGGSVRLDGADIAPWVRADLGGRIGYAPLETHLFEGTVAENIARLGEVDAQKVVEAAKSVGIHETILKFPKGYETRLGETGHVLTGGQRQRLGIARAIYDSPVYLVMDEPNASLDDSGERDLMRLIRELKKRNATVVFTTHRPRLLSVADYTLVLKDGQQAIFGPTAKVTERLSERRDALQGAAAPSSAAAPEAASPSTPQSGDVKHQP